MKNSKEYSKKIRRLYRLLKSKYPKATLTGLDDLRAFYLLADEAKKYHKYAGVESIPMGIDRQVALRRINRSLKELSREWQILNKLAG